MIETLSAGLKPASIDFETLHKNYNPVLALVKELVGVVPNCDPILEIWPPGFRTYNLLVPNLFNLPNTLFGSKSFKASMGLAMYASSKAASCAYCTAHACSFALRRGASADAIKGTRTPKEQAVVAFAEGLARIPADVTLAEVRAVKDYFSESQLEWLMLSVSMMGFLNKFMNAMGIELEQDAINDTATLLSKTGWSPGKHAGDNYGVTKATTPKYDNLLTYLRVIRQAPGAISLEKKWTRGIPSNYSSAAAYLTEHTGYSFPILKPITPPRVTRAITTVLSDNLNTDLTKVGLKTKMLSGYIFSKVVSNDTLTIEMKNMTAHLTSERDDEAYHVLDEIARQEIPNDTVGCNDVMTTFQQQLGLTRKEAATILLTIAAASSPSSVDEAVIETSLTYLDPESIVEIIVWLSVLQLLHRLSSYYTLVKAY
jgi:alkylhydroperoxidase family enzyme